MARSMNKVIPIAGVCDDRTRRRIDFLARNSRTGCLECGSVGFMDDLVNSLRLRIRFAEDNSPGNVRRIVFNPAADVDYDDVTLLQTRKPGVMMGERGIRPKTD